MLANIRVDFVPTGNTAIGPSNRWYPEAIADAAPYRVADGLDVLAITPVYFVATKLEAFRGRGRGDYEASHDLEDILTVLAGIEALRSEIREGASHVATSVRNELATLAGVEAFVDAIEGHFEGDAAGQHRARVVHEWLKSLTTVK